MGFDVFELSCVLKISKVTDGSSNQKRASKTDEIIFSKCISSLVSRYTFETYMNVQLNSLCRSVLRVLSNFLGFGFRRTKKQYFDPILKISIKMYLLPWFENYTSETFINVQLDSPCRSVLRVLSTFLSQFLISYLYNYRVFISQKLINFNLLHTKYFWDPQKCFPDHVHR
jgi:hypothetical protein